MITVSHALNIVADGLRTIYGDEALSVANFALRRCHEEHDEDGEQVWTHLIRRLSKDAVQMSRDPWAGV